jgi:hypothetical protein
VIGAPVSILLTFAAAAVLQNKLQEFPERVREHLLPTWKTGAMYWPFVHSLNFKFVALHHQPFVAHAASLWWNAVLSYRSNVVLIHPVEHLPAIDPVAAGVGETAPSEK